MTSLQRLLAELFVLIALLCGALWYRHELIQDGVRQRIAVEQEADRKWGQKVLDLNNHHDAEKKEIDDAHQKELDDIKTYYANLPIPTRIVLHTAACPSTVSKGGEGSNTVAASRAVLQQDVGVYPDVAPAIGMLMKRADQMLADCRAAVATSNINE